MDFKHEKGDTQFIFANIPNTPTPTLGKVSKQHATEKQEKLSSFYLF